MRIDKINDAIRGVKWLRAQGPNAKAPIKLVAAACAVSRRVLEHSFSRLRRAGHLQAVHGCRGGYMIAAPAGGLDYLSLALAVNEGPLSDRACVRSNGAELCKHCRDADACPTRDALLAAHRALTTHLASQRVDDDDGESGLGGQ